MSFRMMLYLTTLHELTPTEQARAEQLKVAVYDARHIKELIQDLRKN